MLRRTEILRDRIGLLGLLAIVAACAPPASRRREPTCEPSCRAGFVCVDGACVSACNPRCGDGLVCNARAECVVPGADAADVVDAFVVPDIPIAPDAPDAFDASHEDAFDAPVVDVPVVDTPPGPVCEWPLLACDGTTCTDPMVDVTNCQRCGIACRAGLDMVPLCTRGLCATACRSGYVLASGTCVPSAMPGGTWRPIADFPHAAQSTIPAYWNGHEVIALWLTLDASIGYVVGWAYDPRANSWRTLSPAGAPRPRAAASVAFDGISRIFFWGGEDSSTRAPFGDGFVYDTLMDAWNPITTSRAPTARRGAAAVWAGDRFVVWGGADASGVTSTGAEYHPSSDSWTPMRIDARLTPAPRVEATLVWTGREVIVWGGCPALDGASSECFGDGAIYVPSTLSWRAMNASGAPSPRVGFAQAWTGREWLVWGGGIVDAVGTSMLRLDGARYDTTTDRWTALPDAPLVGRFDAAAAWTGTDFLVWGGRLASAYHGDGARFDPVANGWTTLSLAGAPQARSQSWSVWVDDQFVIAGGLSDSGAISSGGTWRQ